MLNIAITAGGTSENIDGIRTLTNVSTGLLGWHCLEATLDFFQAMGRSDFHVFYIITENAFRKELDESRKQFVDFISVTDAESVYNAVDKLTTENRVTHFIHSMAISDFTFSYAVSAGNMAKEIHSLVSIHKTLSVEDIKQVLDKPQCGFSVETKIPSADRLILGLKTTRKVISLIKKNNPDTFLVGFKLLKNVDESQSMDEALKISEKNRCDLVFANELSRISGNDHNGILIQDNDIIARPVGKKQIAVSVVENMFKLTGITK